MNTTTSILKDLGFSEEQALREFALLHASQKVAEFEQEILFFQNKYNMTFSEFAENLQSKGEEILEKEDNFLAWKFAVEGKKYWQTKIDELQRKS